MPATLVLGGVRSGKSAYARRAAEAARNSPALIATAQALDAEMSERIARHRADRSPRWTTIETPIDVPGVLAGFGAGEAVVVDCLTLWLTNLMLSDVDLGRAFKALAAVIAASEAEIWLVGNEVGWGVVPDSPLGRRFRDEAGRLHQDLATVCDDVVLIVAGLPLILKARIKPLEPRS